jgi:hypothetical protein
LEQAQTHVRGADADCADGGGGISGTNTSGNSCHFYFHDKRAISVIVDCEFIGRGSATSSQTAHPSLARSGGRRRPGEPIPRRR